jgi:hypothetical protein
MKTQQSDRWWDDADFQDGLVALLTRDYRTLKDCAALLDTDDFQPQKGMRDGRSRWIVAERALEHYKRHREPVGSLLRADVLQHVHGIGFGAAQKAEVQAYLAKLDALRTEAPAAIVEKVVQFKSLRLKAAAIEELADLHASGALTDEKWSEISKKAMAATCRETATTDYMTTFDSRAERRARNATHPRAPWTFIDPLDSMVSTVGRKQLGMFLAPYKRGKSAALLWMAAAYALQKLRVLYVTLEDPEELMEDRLDSIITHVPLKQLTDYPKMTRRRFERRRGTTGMRHGGIQIYDGTEGGTTVAVLESLLETMRDEGEPADALIVDYDDEVVASQRYKEKRFETDDVYRGLRALNAKYNTIGWTAAQTQRDTRQLKILSGDKVAEDIGKMRKVTCGLSLGKGEWTEDSIFLWVAAHKSDKMDVGCEIIPDMRRLLIFDREATRKAMKEHGGQS